MRLLIIFLICTACALISSAQAQAPPDLRPSFMAVVYRFEGGPNDGKLGYLFRIWNRSGADQTLGAVPGRFNQPILGVLSARGRYADGSPSWAGDPALFEPLFVTGPEMLRASPSEAFADRPANIIVVTNPSTTQIVYTLNGRTATGSLAAARVEVVRTGGLSGRLEVTGVAVVRRLAEGDEIALTVANGLATPISNLTVRTFPAAAEVTLIRKTVAAGALASGAQTTPTQTLLARRSGGGAYALSDFAFAFDDADTLEGLDLDDDGVRDDIQAIIDRDLATTPRVRSYQRGFAKAVQRLDRATTPAEANAAMDALEDFSSCVRRELGLDQATTARIELEMANTDARVRAVLRGWELLSGRTSRVLPSKAARTAFCNQASSLTQ